MIGKGQLLYDATTPADGDSVAAFLHTSDGTLTSTTVGADHGLDVNILNDITVDSDGVYDVGTNATPDTVGSIFHARAASPDETDQTFRSTGGSPSADNLDPANIHAIDSNGFLFGWDGSAWDRLTATAGSLDVNITNTGVAVAGDVADDDADSGNPVKVGFRAIDGALAAVSADDDRADGISDMYRRQYVNAAPNVGMQHAVTTVGTTEVNVDSSPLAGRTKVIAQNLGGKDIYLGATGVTSSGATRGILLPKGATLSLDWGEDIAIYAIGEAAAQELMLLELA